MRMNKSRPLRLVIQTHCVKVARLPLVFSSALHRFVTTSIPRALSLTMSQRQRYEERQRAFDDDKRMIWVRESEVEEGGWVCRTMRSSECSEVMRGDHREESEWSWTAL